LSGKPETTSKREVRFLADRMLGTLTRYLRFMGYDTESANDLAPGNSKEDTILLEKAEKENRILLTRDAELVHRGKDRAILIKSEDVLEEVQQLVRIGLVNPRLRLTRCSICNIELRNATRNEIAGADYAPRDKTGFSFYWCPRCNKLYWNGSHGKKLLERVEGEMKE
jgi:hypothetical protein